MTKTYFGHGIYVSQNGALHIEFRHPTGIGVQEAKSFQESLTEAIAFAERLHGTQSDEAHLLSLSTPRRHAPN